VLGAAIARHVWRWPAWRVGIVFGALLAIDVVFAVANATKIVHGGWVTLVLALGLLALFLTWREGRLRLRQRLRAVAVPLEALPSVLEGASKVPGTGVFLVSDAGYVPTALLRNLEHNHVFHEHIVILHFRITGEPREDPLARCSVEELLPGVNKVTARFGFMETPNLGDALRVARLHSLRMGPGAPSYFVGWHIVTARSRAGWSGIRHRLFAVMQRHSAQAAAFFRMPERRVVVLGTEVDI
jgi:KUP system potassium uptake protein